MACKPGSVSAPKCGDDYSSMAGCCQPPLATYPDIGAGSHQPPSIGQRRVSLHGLAPDGVYHARLVTNPAVRSYRTFSPLPHHAGGAVCFLRHFPWGRPRRALPGILILWSPDFPLPPGFPIVAAVIRPSDSGRIVGVLAP